LAVPPVTAATPCRALCAALRLARLYGVLDPEIVLASVLHTKPEAALSRD